MTMDQALLDQEFFGISLLDWGQMALLWLAIAVALLVVKRLFVGRFSALAARTKNRIDDVVAEIFRGTRAFFIVLVALYLAVEILTEDAPAIPIILRIVFVGLLLQVGLWGNDVIDLWSSWYSMRNGYEEKVQVTAIKATVLVGCLLLWSVLLILALDNFGIDITALVAGLGIGGIAIALAVQNILQDLLAYVSIIVDQPFVYGDYLVIGEFSGTVEHVGIKTTRIRSLSGEQIVFSNADLLQSRLRNYHRMFERRAVFTVGVTYGTSHEKLEQIPGMLRAIVEAQDDVRFDRAHLKLFDDSAITFEVVYYALKPAYAFYMDTQERINLAIHGRFVDEGIEFAFPTQTVHIESMPA
jgi:small-conductance mechanosensitive channel